MDLKTPLLIFLCVANLYPVGSVAVGTALTVVGAVYDVVKFALTVKETIDEFESEPGKTPADLSRLITEINARIDTSTTEMTTSVTLQSKLDRVGDAVVNIHSSLEDLKDILQPSNTQKERDEYIQLFVSRFEEHDLIKHIRFLPNLLEYTIPGTTGKLVDLIAEKSGCNMTAIHAFGVFYSELISEGISLEGLYSRFSKNVSLNETLEKWRIPLVEIQRIFRTRETECKRQFSKNAEEDIRHTENASNLATGNKERYTWKFCDVIFLKSRGTHQFLYYIKSDDNSLFCHKTSIRYKFAIFSDKNQTKPDYTVLKDAEGKIKSSIQGEWDENAAKHVGIAVENHIREQGYAVKNMLVFFDGGEFSSEKIIIDKDSPVLHISINEVTLSYCYASGFVCTLDAANLSGEKKSVTGVMKVYVYVTNATDLNFQHRQIGSSKRNEPATILVYFFLAFCIEVFRTKWMSYINAFPIADGRV